MKKGVKIALIVIGCMVLFVASILTTAFVVTRNASNRKVYKIGKEETKSITAVVGKRKAVGVESSVQGGIVTKKTEYTSDTVVEDLNQYITYLREDEGYLLTRDCDLSYSPGIVYLAKESVDEGKLLYITIEYDLSGYTVIYQKGNGTLQRY